MGGHHDENQRALVSKEQTPYPHLHPHRGEGGEWALEQPNLASREYRVNADTLPRGAGQVFAPDRHEPWTGRPLRVMVAASC